MAPLTSRQPTGHEISRHLPNQSGLARRQATIFSAALRSTLTSWLTPCSPMVTPNNLSIRAMVTAWWGDDHEARIGLARHLVQQVAEAGNVGVVQRRVNLVQNTDRGRVLPGIRRRSAPALSGVCSPPESRLSVLSFLPGGWQRISRPASSGSSLSTSCRRASPPPKRCVNKTPKIRVYLLERGQ